MKRIILTYTLAFSLLSAYAGEGGSPPLKNTDKSLLIDYVDPFIGTTNFGTTNPGAICPNGMMSVVPFNVMGSSENTYELLLYRICSCEFEWSRLSGIRFFIIDAYYRRTECGL